MPVVPNKSSTRNVKLANADNVYDEDLHKYQSEINQMITNGGANVDSIPEDELLALLK